MNSAASLAHHGSLSKDFISAGPSLGSDGALGGAIPAPFGSAADEDDFVETGHDGGVFRVRMTKIVGRPKTYV